MALRRKDPEPPAAPLRPRMQRAVRSEPPAAAPPSTTPGAGMEIVIPPDERGLFRRVIDTLTGRGGARRGGCLVGSRAGGSG